MTSETIAERLQGPMPSARYRHTSFLDLLADAAHNHRRTRAETDPYTRNRAARASITASCLSVECFANCLVDSLETSTQLASEIEKMPALAKIDIFLAFNSKTALDRGAAHVQGVSELIRIRNDHVHPKIVTSQAAMNPPEEEENQVIFPFSVEAKFWPVLNIPKHSLLWDGDASKSTLKALSLFYRALLLDTLEASDEEVVRILLPRFELGNVLMPAIYDEYKVELDALSDDGVDFSFLKL
jgi:hypothetical protein